MRCSGNVAIVTGGAMGIGRAIVEALLAEGAKVVIADRDGAAEAAQALDNAQDNVIGFSCDVSSQGDTEAMASAALEAFGRIDVLVNNAGIYSSLELKPSRSWTRASGGACSRLTSSGRRWRPARSSLPCAGRAAAR